MNNYFFRTWKIKCLSINDDKKDVLIAAEPAISTLPMN